MYKIELINKKTNEITTFDTLVDKNEGEKMFFKFEINTSLLTDGEYTLKLYDDDELIKTETVTVGDYDTKALQYKKGENIYVETILTTNLSDKSVSITETNTTIYPDKGFDGFTSLNVDANNVYDRGVNDGINEQKSKLTSITITENNIYSNEDGYNEVIVDVQPNLQEKYVNVTDNNTTVTTDEEFDGMSKVTVNASPVYNNGYNNGKSDGVEQGYNNGYAVGSTEGYQNGVQVGYNDGYATGKAEGMTTQRDLMTTLSVRSNGLWRRDDGYNEVDVNVESFSYLTNTVDVEGLSELGWSDDDINYYRDNTLHYEWQNKDYIVSQVNKEIVINSSNDIPLYRENPDFEYCPYFETNYGIYWYNIFYGCKFLKGIPSLSTVSATTMNNAFDGCSSLETIFPLDTSTIQTMNYMFRGCTNLKTIPILDTSNVTDMSHIFQGCTNLKTIPQLNTSNVTDMSCMFYGCSNLKTIPQLNTSNVTDMSYMFTDCSNLTTIPQLDTSRVYDVTGLFKGCSNLTSVPPLILTNLSTMSFMFQSCKSLTTIPLFDTSNVVSMTGVFQNCDKLQTIPQLNTSKAQDMGSLFSSCTSLHSLPLLDFSSATNISSFFGYSSITTLTDLGGFKNLKIDWKDNYGFAKLPNLTKQSVLNVINNVYDFRANGDSTTTRTLKFHKNSLALLTDDDKAIATNKGWTLTS